MFRLLIATAFFFAANLPAQEKPPSPDLTREKLRQWIQTKKIIARESVQWESEKQMLSDLIALRDRESSQMDEVISQAQERVADVEKETGKLASEEKARELWRGEFEKKVTGIEDALIPRIAYLPNPLKDKMTDAISRLEDRDDEGDLQGRFRDVLAILNEAISFNSQIQMIPEIREVENQRIEVEVLYLGLHQAWYVDHTERIAGVGIPTKEGWIWKPDHSIASRVRRAIDIQTRKEPPAFTRLPLSNGAENTK